MSRLLQACRLRCWGGALPWAAGAGLLAAALGYPLYCWGWSMDDPYIVYRYADSLVHGRGLVLNPGEPVEAYSSLTHILILAGLRRMGLPFDPSNRWLGILCHLATTALLFLAGQRRAAGRPALFRWLASGLFAVSFPAGAYAVGGLETSLFGLLLFAAMWLYVEEEELGRGFRWSAILLFVLALTRIEAPLVFVCLAAHQAALHGRRRTWPQPRAVVWFGVYVGLYAAYTLFRWRYFGSLLPNTFYAKATGPPLEQWRSGAQYSLDFARHFGFFPLSLCLVPLAFRSSRAQALPWLLVLGGYVAFIVYCGGDWMKFYRFFAPLLPLVFWLFQEGAWALVHNARRRGICLEALAAGALVAACSAAFVASDARQAWREFRPLRAFIRRHGEYLFQFVQVAEYLKRHSSPDQWLASEAAGIIPFLSGNRFLDVLGLTDRHVARAPGGLHAKSDADYILGRRPDFILLEVRLEKPEGKWVAFLPPGQAILDHPAFLRDYTLDRTFELGDELDPAGLQYALFRRKETADSRPAGRDMPDP